MESLFDWYWNKGEEEEDEEEEAKKGLQTFNLV